MNEWDHALTRPLQLADGTVLLTLADAHSAIEAGQQTRLNAIVVADALRALEDAAKSGGSSPIERATERAHVALTMQRRL
jgi:hypothetical protein